jgi:hypothetical protein
MQTIGRAGGILSLALLIAGCTRANPNYCEKNSDCSGGRVCSVVHSACVWPDSAAEPLDSAIVTEPDAAADGTVDVLYAPEVTLPVDTSIAAEVGKPDVAVDAAVVDAAKPDTKVGDGPGTCAVNGDCADPTAVFCVGGMCTGCQNAGPGACGVQACDLASGKCVECTADGQCTKDPAKGFCVAKVCTGCGTAGSTGCAARTDGNTVCSAGGACVECAADSQCTKDAAKGFCVSNACTGCKTPGATGCTARTDGKSVCANTGACVECSADAQCTKDADKGFCVGNACTGCGTAGATGCAGRTDGKTVCATSGACVECSADAQCTKDPAKGFCVANACTGCATAGATGCVARTDGKAVCAATGAAAGQCVECAADTQCTKDAAKGFCVANACTGCSTPGATGCAARTDGKAVCATAGTATGQCVECSTDGQCTKDATKSFCVANACAGCQLAAANACSTRSAAKPVCGTTGVCVECNTSADCSVTTKPICTSTTCGACTTDSQCVAKLGANPGVCLGHIDGHCATDAETVYVGTSGTATCSESNAGTVLAPVCSAQSGVGIAKSNSKPLVVIRGTLTPASTTIAVSAPLTIVGKSTAVLAPAATGADAIDITSGEVYLRELTFQGGTSTGIGINAAPAPGSTVTVYMDTCTVTNNPGGGILLNGASFDIENTKVTGNGPGTTNPGGTVWGGIRVDSLPANGPTTLNRVTVQNNQAPGLSCSGGIQGASVLVTGNTLTQITPSCAVTSCTPDAGTGCGAQ